MLQKLSVWFNEIKEIENYILSSFKLKYNFAIFTYSGFLMSNVVFCHSNEEIGLKRRLQGLKVVIYVILAVLWKTNLVGVSQILSFISH